MGKKKEIKGLEPIEENEKYCIVKNDKGYYQIIINDEQEPNIPIILIAKKYDIFLNEIYYVSYDDSIKAFDLNTLSEKYLDFYEIANINGKKLLNISYRIYDENGSIVGEFRTSNKRFYKRGEEIFIKDDRGNLGTRLFTPKYPYQTYAKATTTEDDNAVFHECINYRNGKTMYYDTIGRLSHKETESGKEIYRFINDDNMKMADITPEFLVDEKFYETVVHVSEDRIEKYIESIKDDFTNPKDVMKIRSKLEKSLKKLALKRQAEILKSKLRINRNTANFEI